MKRIVLLLVLSVIAAGAWAQGAVGQIDDRILVEGKCWTTVDSKNFFNPEKIFHYVTVKGEMEVDGKACKVLVDDKNEAPYNRIPAYEENNVLYVGIPGDDDSYQFVPVLDFNVKVGDVVKIGSGMELTVKSIDILTAHGYARKRINIGTEDNPVYWIEGIGTGNINCLMSAEYFRPIILDTPVMSVSLNGESIFDPSDWGMKQNPFSGVETVADAGADADDTVYDLYGRHVSNPQAGQIYIRNHKKIIFGH